MQLTTRRSPHNIWAFSVATLAGITATLAFAGAAGLLTGVLDPGDAVADRIPFGSTAFGGLALALIVGIPMALTTRLAVAHDPRATAAAIGAGLLLIAWIVVEISIIKEFSWLQPTFVTIGVVLAACGLTRHRLVQQ